MIDDLQNFPVSEIRDPDGAMPAKDANSETILVDARGHRCPVPTLKLGRALQKAAAGDEIELLADDPMARIDAPHFVATAGHGLLSVTQQDGLIRIRVKKRAG